MKKLLYITHLSGKRVNRFWISAIKAAQGLGFEFHLACNMEEAEHPGWEEDCIAWQIKPHHIDFDRNPLSMVNIRAKKQLKELIEKEHFDIVHCNTPVGGLLGRICAYKSVPSIIYQAHGFHFWKGAPIRNWLIYYPVEKWLAKKTNVLITINKEDSETAKIRIKAKETAYVPGVGVDTELFRKKNRDLEDKRNELGLNESDFVILSVGELIRRKNHAVVLEALGEMKKTGQLENTQFIICGQGILEEALKKRTVELGIAEHVRFLGYRKDINEIYSVSDLFVFPSLQEGLPVAVMEAMASGTPVICSNIRGNNDLIENNRNGEFADNDPESVKRAIIRMRGDRYLREKYAEAAAVTVKQFDISVAEERLREIYSRECAEQ